jgi:hypothetical protein
LLVVRVKVDAVQVRSSKRFRPALPLVGQCRLPAWSLAGGWPAPGGPYADTVDDQEAANIAADGGRRTLGGQPPATIDEVIE